MKNCSYCGAANDDAAAVCSGCGTSSFVLDGARTASWLGRWLLSLWSLRAGVVLAFLPIPALGTALLYLQYLFSVWKDSGRAPEDYAWGAAVVGFWFLCFAAVCLLPSIAFLLMHVRHSRGARWALACAASQAVLILCFLVYVKVADS
jgi:hypothetical protein